MMACDVRVAEVPLRAPAPTTRRGPCCRERSRN